MDVNLSLKLSKAAHDRCHNVPHDIGITLEQIVREHQNEQLNIHSVMQGLQELKDDINWIKTRMYTKEVTVKKKRNPTVGREGEDILSR